jgi:hypothetical protein
VENEPSKIRSTRSTWWRLPLLLALVLVAIVWYRVHGLRDASAKKSGEMPATIAASDPRPKVNLSIDFGGGRRTRFAAIAWHDGMSVADLMNAWPTVTITQKGSGDSAMVTAIDGIANEGADGKNWLYRVNGKFADRSFAVYELKPGDQVLWTFGPRQ